MSSTATAEHPAEAGEAAPERHRVVVIGTGFAGLGMAIRLQRAGEDFVVLERASSVGGTPSFAGRSLSMLLRLAPIMKQAVAVATGSPSAS